MVRTTGSLLVLADSMMTKNRDRSDVELTTHLLPFFKKKYKAKYSVFLYDTCIDVSLVPRFILGLQLHVQR